MVLKESLPADGLKRVGSLVSQVTGQSFASLPAIKTCGTEVRQNAFFHCTERLSSTTFVYLLGFLGVVLRD